MNGVTFKAHFQVCSGMNVSQSSFSKSAKVADLILPLCSFVNIITVACGPILHDVHRCDKLLYFYHSVGGSYFKTSLHMRPTFQASLETGLFLISWVCCHKI